MKIKPILTSIFLSSTLLTTGCASIVSDSTYPVNITSIPENAAFTITNELGETVHTGTTPETVELASGDGYFSSSAYTIAFAKEGYQQQSIMITSTLDGWYFGNLFLGGLIGMVIVDPLTGAMFKLQDTAQVELIATNYQSNNANKSLQVVSLSDLPEKYHAELVKIN
ncbi:hypothetical protein [Spartinivicinus ruber]|uniref:hypothetical protein n=1 Tax=Spartinivicinus ruber TaxID=2683272 RepID=UPI0013CF9B92|nr:hypothetical protein [Spartinivicinus ruber]